MTSAFEAILPAFAPLSGRMVLALLEGRRRQTRRIMKLPANATNLEREKGYQEAEWQSLLRELQALRPAVFHLLDPLVQTKTLSTDWLLQALSKEWLLQTLANETARLHSHEEPFSHPSGNLFSDSTLTTWRQRGIVLYEERNKPDYRSVAPLLLMRALDKRENKFLPPTLTEEDRHWFCWRQDNPHLAPVPYRVPLTKEFPTAGLPQQAILWTPWVGAIWNGHWMKINSTGAIRFAHITMQQENINWNITLEHIQLWDPAAASLNVPLSGMTSDILQKLGDLTLLRFAYVIFQQSSPKTGYTSD